MWRKQRQRVRHAVPNVRTTVLRDTTSPVDLDDSNLKPWTKRQKNRVRECDVWMGLVWCSQNNGACLLGHARSSHNGSCCGPPSASPLWHRCTVNVLAVNHRCALMPKMASHQNANPLLLECLVNVSWRSSKQNQRDFSALLLCAFRVPCLTTIFDCWSLENENTNTPARRVAVLRAARRLLRLFVSPGCSLQRNPSSNKPWSTCSSSRSKSRCTFPACCLQCSCPSC